MSLSNGRDELIIDNVIQRLETLFNIRYCSDEVCYFMPKPSSERGIGSLGFRFSNVGLMGKI